MKKTTYEKVVSLHERGATPSKICDRLDIHKSSVSKYLKKYRETIDSIPTKRSKDTKTIKSPKSIKVSKYDSWVNAISGQNVAGRDRKASYKFIGQVAKSKGELEDFYRFNGFARKIIDLIPEEMVRQWITIDGDSEGVILEKLDKLSARPIFRRFLSFNRLYGGCLIFIGIDDGGAIDEPVNENRIKDISFIKSFDRFQVTKIERYQDPTNENFGEPEFYFVKPVLVSTSDEIKIHSSRVLTLGGGEVPDSVKLQNDGWGDSEICKIYEQLKNIGIAYNSTADVLETYDQGVLMVPDVLNMVAQGNQDILMKRLQALDLTKGIINSILIGNNESYEKKTTSVSGLDDLISTFEFALSAVTGIPHSKLFGEGASGLNNSGEADIRNFYDNIKSMQQDLLYPNLNKLVRYIILSRDLKVPSRDIKDYCIDFVSLWQLSDMDEADIKLKNAQADQIYIQNGVLDNTVVTRSRFGGTEYNNEITLTENEQSSINNETTSLE